MSYLPFNSSFIPPTVAKPFSTVKRAPTVLGKRSLPSAQDAYDTLDDLAANYKTLPDVEGNEENERAAKRQRGGDSSGIIIGGTAGRGSLGPPGCNYTKTKKDPILAHERTSVIPYQVSVVTLCAVPRPDTLYEERRREAARYPATDLIAPVQDAGCFRVNKGELVFSLMSGTGAPLRNVHEYDGYPNVFSSVNGLHYSARLRFEGFMAFNQAPSHPDEVGTLQRFGTCTVNWTGPFPGYAGQIVYFSPYPYVREVDGQIEPAIRLLGAPGQEGEKDESGVSRAKFVPSLYTLNEQETATAIRSIERDLEGKIRKKMHTTNRAQGGAGAGAGAGASTGFQVSELDSICKDIETNHFLRHPQVFALRDYAIVSIYLMVFEAQLAINKVNGGTITPNMIAIGRAFFKRLKEYYAHMQHESNAFRESLSAKSAAYSHPILQPEIDAELANDAAWYTMDSAFFRGHYYTLSQLLVKWAHRLQIYLFNQQEDFLRSHCIGTLMRDTHPGGSADLILGAFYR